MSEVSLRPMRADEFAAFRRPAVLAYAEEIARAGDVPAPDALARAEEDFGELLPDGLQTDGHRFLVGELDGTGVGIVWFAARETKGGRVAWLYEIEVEEVQRGRGLGRRLMQLFEEQARSAGFRRIELNVWGHNDRARHLYASLGYGEMSRQLFKELEPR